MDRRTVLKGLGLMGCSAAAHPWLTTVTLAGGVGLGERRLIVVILRGAMDGLDVVRPSGEAVLARYRPTIAAAPGPDLDGFFTLHPALAGLMPLWAKGELGFAHATSTPYRDKRSHFDGQDMLEAGTGMDVPLAAVRDGWMNRMLQAVPGLTAQTAIAVGSEAMPLLRGPAPFLDWSPSQALNLSAEAQLLLEQIYHDDPLFQSAAAEAVLLSAQMSADQMGTGTPPAPKALAEIDALADFAAGHLAQNTRIAAFSLAGWDTHHNQAGAIQRPLQRLQRLILRCRSQLGPQVWGQTLVLAMTEFGRTARENGSQGTDHGTAGAMVMAGGALRGGRVYGRWPGLAEAALYDRRDLMPTSDVRSWAGWAMRGLYGFDASLLQRVIFPGLELGPDPKLLL